MTEPDDDGIDWAEVARAGRAARGECWYKVHLDGTVIDWWCEVHERYEPPPTRRSR